MNQPFMQKPSTLADRLERLLSLTEKELEEALAPLKFSELSELLLQIPWEKRAKFILLSPFPEGLVRNMPLIELFFTLKASSLDEAVELLSYAKGSQLQFLLDFDCWYKDRLKAERILSWIILFFEAGEDTVKRLLEVIDWDFLLAIFQKFVRVHKRPDDVELIEAYDYLPSYTLDDLYFIEFKEERVEYYFRRMIEIIREEWPETYFSLMESLIWELPSEVEERTFRFRNGRLADEGIPDYYTALEVYTYIHPKALSSIEPSYLALSGEVSGGMIYLLPYEGTSDLFIFKVLSHLEEPSIKERIMRELAWLATKVTLVDFPVIDGLEEVKKGIFKMWCGLNLGLEYLTEGNLEKGKHYLENYFLEEIFRVSRTALRELRRFALTLINNKDFSAALLKYLDQPYEGYLKGVIAKNLNEVKLFNPTMIGTSEEYTEFSRVSELRMVRRYIEEIAYMAPLLEKGLGPIQNWIREILRPGRNIELNFFTLSTLILTALAHYLHKKEFTFKAIPASNWSKILAEMFETREGKNYLKKTLKEILFESFRSLAKALYYVEEELLRSYLEQVISKLENEFRYADLSHPPDPQYQTLILVEL